MKQDLNLLNKAKYLRKNMTVQEKKLWSILRNRNFCNLRFKRQVCICNYIVDFYCPAKNLIIEVDGGQHNEDTNIKYDEARANFLKTKGYKVLRFWNSEIDNNLEGACETIIREIN